MRLMQTVQGNFAILRDSPGPLNRFLKEGNGESNGDGPWPGYPDSNVRFYVREWTRRLQVLCTYYHSNFRFSII
jgi:hypothetical protein